MYKNNSVHIYSVNFKTAALHSLGSDTVSSSPSGDPFLNFGNGFERGLLVMGVPQLEEIFSHALMKFRFPHTIVGVGSNDVKVELLEKDIFCGFFYLFYSGELTQISNLFLLESDFESVVK